MLFSEFKSEDVSVIDIEANGLDDATQIHVVVIREILDGNVVKTVFRNPTGDPDVKASLSQHLSSCRMVAGHHILGFDCPTLLRLCDIKITCPVLDTLVLSRLVNYSIPGGHSLEAWGDRFGVKKLGAGITDWSCWTQEMEDRCGSDTEINWRIVDRYHRIWSDPAWQPALKTEHFVARMCWRMHNDGFCFNSPEAEVLADGLRSKLSKLDDAIRDAFPPKATPIREIHPRRTAKGTLDRTDFRWLGSDDLSCFTGGPFTRFEYVPFNPGSPRQIVERLNAIGWRPTDKTDGHKDALLDRSTPAEKLTNFKKYGWKVNEENLSTLPRTAPAGAFSLASRIVLASRLSDLDEWLAAATPQDSETTLIHGSFQSIGAWTQRLSHQKPNTANIPQSKPSEKDTPFQREIQDLNGRMRALFRARPGYRLVGTDADGIQMRIFAHLCQDKELIDALVRGRKEDKTDIHSLNKSLLGPVCGSRDVAKTFIYAFLLGAGAAKVAEILGCSISQAKEAVANFIAGLPGLGIVKKKRIPQDVRNGYFSGLDGRKVICSSTHLMMSGYLQNGEKVIMARAMEEWVPALEQAGIDFKIPDWVHDEWQTEIPDDDEICKFVQDTQCTALLHAGESLGLLLPTPGSSDWGYTWKDTH